MGRASIPQTPPEPQPVEIVCSIKLSNGHFQSEFRVSLDAPVEEKQRQAEKWMEMMTFCFKMGITYAEADFAPKSEPSP